MFYFFIIKNENSKFKIKFSFLLVSRTHACYVERPSRRQLTFERVSCALGAPAAPSANRSYQPRLHRSRLDERPTLNIEPLFFSNAYVSSTSCRFRSRCIKYNSRLLFHLFWLGMGCLRYCIDLICCLYHNQGRIVLRLGFRRYLSLYDS